MRLYVTNRGRWAGTQADAKTIAATDGAWKHVEVPTDKAALLAFLNENGVMEDEPAAEPDGPVSVEMVQVPGPILKAPDIMTMTYVEEFIQQANPAQLHSLSGDCISRLRELLAELPR